MADEEQNENVEETTPEAEAVEAPEAAETPEAEAAPEAEAEAPAEEAPEEPAAEEAPTDGPVAEAPQAEAPAEPAEPVAPATPKERRQASRAARAARSGAQPARTPEERQAARDAARAKKATARRGLRAKVRAKQAELRAANPGEPTPPREHGEGRQKTRQGVVVSDKADKTITVRVDVARRHRRYEKIVRSSSTLHAHDESNDAHIGDTVVVRECRPLSRLKRWRLVEVVERAK
jgi:small subunit ribosomal protein S17